MTVLIKRYANRKLYNTDSSRYITLKGISELVHEGTDIRVVDNETGNDLTSVVLSQILVDDQKQGRETTQPVPGRVLSELIQKGGDALYDVFRRGVDDAHENIAEFRESVRRWVHTPGGAEGARPRAPESSEISRLVTQSVERVLRLVDLPTRSDLEQLNKNLERLAAALETFEDRLRALERPRGPGRDE
jgi:polyhydroxyalkanoate synthesis repressor PhaR